MIINEVTRRPKWSGYDIYEYLPLLPVVAAEPPNGKLRQRHKPPQARGMSEEQWIEHLGSGGDAEFVSDEEYEEDSTSSAEEELVNVEVREDTSSGDEEVHIIDVDNEEESDKPSDDERSQNGSHQASDGSSSAGGEGESAPLFERSAPMTPKRKRNVKTPAPNIGIGEEGGIVQDSSSGPQTPDAQVRQIMAASQSPTQQGRGRGAAKVPSRVIGRTTSTK